MVNSVEVIKSRSKEQYIDVSKKEYKGQGYESWYCIQCRQKFNVVKGTSIEDIAIVHNKIEGIDHKIEFRHIRKI